jgi:hypothetical protein
MSQHSFGSPVQEMRQGMASSRAPLRILQSRDQSQGGGSFTPLGIVTTLSDRPAALHTGVTTLKLSSSQGGHAAATHPTKTPPISTAAVRLQSSATASD